ncbi:unnamed protein product, partial [Prorocentrum cordatum]
DANIDDVLESLNDRQDSSEKVFEVPAVIVAFDDAENLLTQKGDRVFTQVSVSDYSATATASLTHDPALKITNAQTLAKFTELAAKGCLSCSRAHVRIRRAPDKDGKPKLFIVVAEPRLFETPAAPASFIPSDERVVPTTLSSVKPGPAGKLAVTVGDRQILAVGALALVQATQEAETTLRSECCYAVENVVKDCLGDGAKEYKGATTALLPRLSRYAMAPGTTALVHITNVQVGSDAVDVADVWPVATGDVQACIEAFQSEVSAFTGLFEAASEPPPKRMRASFDAPAVPREPNA